MSKPKSPIDQLFFDLYGHYPKKAGTAYELLVAAVQKILTSGEVLYDQHLRGTHSKTDYQLDALVKEKASSKMVEAKDYTIDDRKVGRGDLQKLQGALSDLNVDSGVFASATEFSKPAKKYAESSTVNPLHKPIELINVRPSTVEDENGRIKEFIVHITLVEPDYSKGQYVYAWSERGWAEVEKQGLVGKNVTVHLEAFYNRDGSVAMTLADFTYNNQPIHLSMDDPFAEGCWVLRDCSVRIEGNLFEIKGIQYKIPYTKSSPVTVSIKAEGTPRVLVQSEDGKLNKLLTDKQFRELTFDQGSVKA